MTLDKNLTKVLISGYLDGELNTEEKMHVEKLLSQSDEFKSLYESEKKVKLFVAERVKTEAAPSTLKNRINRQFKKVDHKPSLFELFSAFFEYRPISSSFTLIILVGIFLIPNFSFLSSENFVEFTHLKGEVVCIDCDIFSKHISVPEHSLALHRIGIKTEDGLVFTIIHNDEGSNVDFSILHKRVELSGVMFNDLKYVKVNEYHLL